METLRERTAKGVREGGANSDASWVAALDHVDLGHGCCSVNGQHTGNYCEAGIRGPEDGPRNQATQAYKRSELSFPQSTIVGVPDW